MSVDCLNYSEDAVLSIGYITVFLLIFTLFSFCLVGIINSPRLYARYFKNPIFKGLDEDTLYEVFIDKVSKDDAFSLVRHISECREKGFESISRY